VALVLAAGGAAFFLLKGTGDVIDRLIPSSTNIYVTAYLDPAASQKVNLLRVSKKFPALQNSEALNSQIDQAIDEGLSDVGVRAADVRPWLGSQIALAVRLVLPDPEIAFVIASKDDGAAGAALDKARRDAESEGQTWTRSVRSGVEVFQGSLDGTAVAYALVDHAVVVANRVAFLDEVIATSKGRKPALSSSPKYEETADALPAERLGLAYADLGSFIKQMAQAGLQAGADPAQVRAQLAQLESFSGIGATLIAEPDGLSLEFVGDFGGSTPTPTASPSPEPNAALSYVPSTAFGVASVAETLGPIGGPLDLSAISNRLPEPLASQFQELDRTLGLSEAIGDLTGTLAVEVGPGASGPVPGGAAIVGIRNATDFRGFLDRVAAFAAGELGASTVAPHTEIYRGAQIVSMPIPDLAPLGFVPAYTVTPEVAIVGTSADEVKALLDTKQAGNDLTTTPTFRRAVGSRSATGPLVYADVQGIAQAVRDSLDPNEQVEYDTLVAPNIRPIKAFVLVTRSTSHGGVLRLFVLIP
jgi:hypothetical protein